MEIKAVIKKLPTNNSPGPSGLIDEFHYTIKDLIPILFKTKTEEEEMLPNSLTLASIILIPKPEKHKKINFIGQYAWKT